MNIIVSIKSNYGRELVYPQCEKSRSLAALAGTTTLTADSIAIIKTLGYTISVQAQEL